ncbi:MAG TPA: 50S ribosome-binding GTPase [Candidatus Wallbacteria bacterium]|nr:MAG: GTPase Era [bacterium ADurb.Bin243]HOD39458.1 50S ribosome-binding GTPase [Candidatus Wallbacteria bacterium]HPG56577.1 50S ribosome-binding GTPase [Candidatus Wallbacteria bacterium]
MNLEKELDSMIKHFKDQYCAGGKSKSEKPSGGGAFNSRSRAYTEETVNSEWQDMKFEGEFEGAWKKAERDVEDDLDRAVLNIPVVGTVNCGKSSFIKAITGREDIKESPKAGETVEVNRYEFPGCKNVFIYDTPGLEDVNSSISARATGFIENNADLVLYFVNSSAGVTANVRKAFNDIKKLNKPVVVILSKIDTLGDENDYKIALDDCNEKLGLVKEEHAAIGVSTRKNAPPAGLEKAVARITAVLGDEAKVILWGRLCRYKEEQANSIINWSAGESFGVGALPIPGSDAIAISGIQFKMIYQLAKLYEKELNKEFIQNIFLQLGINSIGKKIFVAVSKGVSWMFGPPGPAVVSAVAAVTAGSITYGLGHTFKKILMASVPPSVEELVKSFQQKSNEYYKSYNKIRQ